MNRIKIIIADDNKHFRMALEMVMQDFKNVDVISAVPNGKELLESLSREKADVVFMDIEMPEMDGFQATREALQLFPDLVVIAFSTNSHVQYVQRVIEAGAKGYLVKGAENSRVLEEIATNPYKGMFFSDDLEYFRKLSSLSPKSVLVSQQLNYSDILTTYLQASGHRVISYSNYMTKPSTAKNQYIDLVVTQMEEGDDKLVSQIKKLNHENNSVNPTKILIEKTADSKSVLLPQNGTPISWLTNPVDYFKVLDQVYELLNY